MASYKGQILWSSILVGADSKINSRQPSGSTMQLHDTANDGQERNVSVISYPAWSSSSSDPSCTNATGKHNHWWPSQAYHCTFCPRVFRTAQALGGHMNIHRRERAFANDTGTRTNSILSRSSSLPGSLYGGQVQLNHHIPPSSCMVHCYANRRIADSCQESGNISDPLSWLFSQLPPPGSITAMQQSRGSNKELAKPYHRALDMRRSALSQAPMEMRGATTEASCSRNGDGDDGLDLELRLWNPKDDLLPACFQLTPPSLEFSRLFHFTPPIMVHRLEIAWVLQNLR